MAHHNARNLLPSSTSLQARFAVVQPKSVLLNNARNLQIKTSHWAQHILVAAKRHVIGIARVGCPYALGGGSQFFVHLFAHHIRECWRSGKSLRQHIAHGFGSSTQPRKQACGLGRAL